MTEAALKRMPQTVAALGGMKLPRALKRQCLRLAMKHPAFRAGYGAGRVRRWRAHEFPACDLVRYAEGYTLACWIDGTSDGPALPDWPEGGPVPAAVLDAAERLWCRA